MRSLQAAHHPTQEQDELTWEGVLGDPRRERMGETVSLQVSQKHWQWQNLWGAGEVQIKPRSQSMKSNVSYYLMQGHLPGL